MRGNETRGRIVTNCCTGVGVHDVITCADLYYDRLRGLGVAGGQILGFSIDLLRRPYNTLALPCECVIMRPFPIEGRITRYTPFVCPSVCALPTVNSKTESHTTFKSKGEVT